jgi:hypothetical protein
MPAPHLATPDAFAAWAAEHFSSVVHTALRPDGRGIVVTRTVLTSHPPYFCGYVIGGAHPEDLDAAPCHGGVTLEGRERRHHLGRLRLQPRARRAQRNSPGSAPPQAHALADWLSETELHDHGFSRRVRHPVGWGRVSADPRQRRALE